MSGWIKLTVLQFARVPCGAYGGVWEGGPRWCWKRFGHSDSHAFDVGQVQPLDDLRRRAQGWGDQEDTL